MDEIYKHCYILYAKTGYRNRKYFVECKKREAYIYCFEEAKKGFNLEECLMNSKFYDI